MNSKNKVVLVTGAGRGYGREVAKAFAKQGARLALNDISPLNLNRLVKEIEEMGGEAKAYVQDIAKKIPVQGLVMHVEDDFGRIDILINYSAVEPKKPLLEMDEWDWQRTLLVNLSAPFLMTQSVGRMMKEKGGGVIVNLIPLAGRWDKVGETAYLSSTLGMVALTHQAARELAEHHVRVHAVATGIAQLHQAEEGHPSHFIEAVLYLCDEEQENLVGQIINTLQYP
ncbi:MAG TPA: SDR family NAD(P)-dependent oxidoreductase [Anaerolineales bacterium]|nr:SDR family NAD(P)-dependent oxidoreductase [Anaerolineales bacterium]